MPPRTVQLLLQLARHDGQRDELRMRMIERRTSRGAMVLEDDDVAQADVAFQVEHTLAPRPEDFLNRGLRQRRERLAVTRCLDDDFVRADAVHAIEQPFAFAIEIALHAQCRKLVGYDAHVPPTAVSIGKDRWRRFILMTLAERAKLVALRRRRFDVEVAGPLLALGRDDDPAASNGIFSEVGHDLSLRRFHIDRAFEQFYCARASPFDNRDDIKPARRTDETLDEQVRRGHVAEALPFFPRHRFERSAEIAT